MTSSATSVEGLMARVNALRGRFREIESASGLSYSWLCKFAQGRQANPTIGTIERLTRGLAAVERSAVEPEPERPPAVDQAKAA